MNAQQRQYEGGCHCGAVRFQIITDQNQAVDCNCSICHQKGFLHLIVPDAQFTLLKGQDQLTIYRFNTGIAQHQFCRTCGIHSFYRPRSHPEAFDVNIRCLDGDVMADFEIVPFDGRHWEENIDQIQDNIG